MTNKKRDSRRSANDKTRESITFVLRIALYMAAEIRKLERQKKKLAKELHREIDYSEKLQNKINKLKQRKLK